MEPKQIGMHDRLARECAKLNPAEERAMAEEGMAKGWLIGLLTIVDYQLLDFGNGRRLERFGEIVLDRPCPAAEAFQRADSDLWTQADARFEGARSSEASGSIAANCPSAGSSRMARFVSS